MVTVRQKLVQPAIPVVLLVGHAYPLPRPAFGVPVLWGCAPETEEFHSRVDPAQSIPPLIFDDLDNTFARGSDDEKL